MCQDGGELAGGPERSRAAPRERTECLEQREKEGGEFYGQGQSRGQQAEEGVPREVRSGVHLHAWIMRTEKEAGFSFPRHSLAHPTF